MKATDPIEPSESAPEKPSAQKLVAGFYVVLGLCLAGLLWLAVRAESPASVRTILDIFMQLALGGSVVVLAFLALVAYPYRTADLIVMVTVLSISMKVVLDVIGRFSAIGLIHASFAGPEHIGEIAQTCLLSASVLLAGGAFALRTCQRANIHRPLPRIMTIVSGMLALPAAAGSIAFFMLLIIQLVKGDSENAPAFAALWILSMGITLNNVGNIVRGLRLN